MMLSDLPVGSSGDSGVGGGKPAAPVVVPSPSADVDQVVGKESNNLLLFVCYLYVFNTVYHGLVFELLDCNIYELIKGRRHHLPEQTIKVYMYQLMKAMDHMHK